MSEPTVRPDSATAARLLDGHDVVPLVIELPAAGETPVSLMQRLGVGGHCFLLESATGRQGVHGYSFLGHDPDEVAREDGGRPAAPPRAGARRAGRADRGLDVPFLGGWVGYLGYEAAGVLRALPVAAAALPGVPPASSRCTARSQYSTTRATACC